MHYFLLYNIDGDLMEYLIIDLNDFDQELLVELLGEHDKNLDLISNFYHDKLIIKNGCLLANKNEQLDEMKRVFNSLIEIYQANQTLDQQDIISTLNNNYVKKFIANGLGSKKYYLRTVGQEQLYKSFENNVITFAIGPAGSGKTFLAVVYCYNLLRKGTIRKIVITRPVVESGESLGFLPGDLQEKIDPYLRPIYDCFESLIGQEALDKLIEKQVIEIAPLAYMRGRTLNDAAIILDEGQNTTIMQMKMFLTRLGFNSKMIITGDISQVDLPANKKSGLISVINTIKDIDEIGIITMNNQDVVRHPLVSKIIDAYNKEQNESKHI